MSIKVDYEALREKDEKLSYQSTIALHEILKKFGDKYRITIPDVPPFKCTRKELTDFWRSLSVQSAKLSGKLNSEEKVELIYVGAAIGAQVVDEPAN